MARLALVAFSLLAMVAPCLAQTVKIPAEMRVNVGEFSPITAETDCGKIEWWGVDPGLSVFPARMLADSKSTVVIALKPGRYRLAAYGAKGDTPSPMAVCVVIVGDGNPAPPVPPPPSPGPGPAPTPVIASGGWVVAVTDQDADSVAVATALASKEFRDEAARLGFKFRLYDKSSPVIAQKNLSGYVAKAGGAPALVFQNQDGEVVSSVKCPETGAALVELLRKVAGK
jgi:hypothetical protein